MKLIFTEEYKFLLNLFFNEKKIDLKNIKKINNERLITISSTFLLLPLLYVRLKNNKLLRYFPNDFKNYIREIYKINFNRNKKLIIESERLKEELISNKIKFKFTKGCFYLRNNIYEDIGERMVGDIDFIYDYDKEKELIRTLNRLGYKNDGLYLIWKTKHLKRFTSVNEIFAIEPHREFLIYRFKKILEAKRILSQSQDVDKLLLIKQCIYNFMINDYGNLKASIDLKTIIDYFMICNGNHKIIYDYNDKYFRRFKIILINLNLSQFKIKMTLLDKLYLSRLKLKNNNKIFYLIDNLVCNILIISPIKIMQLVEFTFNKEYRESTLKKLCK